MKCGSNANQLRSAARVEEILETIDLAGRKLRKSRRRFAAYPYLKSIYRGHEKLAKTNRLPLLRKGIKLKFGIKVSKSSHPLRALIDATSREPDIRVRSRWARALEYALSQNIASADLIKTIKQSKGIAGVARLAASTQPKRPSREFFLKYMPELSSWKTAATTSNIKANLALKTP